MNRLHGPSLEDFVECARYGAVYFCWNWPWEFGWQTGFCDGWHFCLHCGPFSVEVS